MAEPITTAEVFEVLHAIERGEITVSNPNHGYCGVERCEASNGWIFHVFNDCDEWDYIDYIETPDGMNFDPWEIGADSLISDYQPPCDGVLWGWKKPQ